MEPWNSFAAHVTLFEVSHIHERIFVIFGTLRVVFATFASSDPASVKIFKELLPALPVLG